MSVTGHPPMDPVWCEEYGYRLGDPGGILVLKYRAAGPLEFAESRQDFLHQLYWSPDGMLSTVFGSDVMLIGSQEAFWVERAVSHDVRAGDRQTVYRIYLREVPSALEGLRVGAVSVDERAARLIQSIARPGYDENAALGARQLIMAGLGASTEDFVGHHSAGSGYAMTVARALSHDPGDDTLLGEWADLLHISPKTLQRDFIREFGLPYSRWRTRLRLRAARVLLETQPVARVAQRVGYASPSAFITAFGAEFGYTPGRHRARETMSA